METIVPEDSPLAAYLEGRGEAEPQANDETSPGPDRSLPQSYAPRVIPSLRFIKLPGTSRARASHIISRLKRYHAVLVTSTLGSADNTRFLEHFRYILIASQLLDEHGSSGVPRSSQLSTSPLPGLAGPVTATTLTGTIVTGVAAFALVWTLDWTRSNRAQCFSKSRIFLFVCILAALGVVLYAYIRRQWLQYLRRQAIGAASEFVERAESLDASAGSVITLIQEVELVARGYRLSNPLPPASRIEGKGFDKKCGHLRHTLQQCQTSLIPAFSASIERLRQLADAADLDRFLEVYDIRPTDLDQVIPSVDDQGDAESLKQLRLNQHSFTSLKRLFLCILLSTPATGRKEDMARWRAVVDELTTLSSLLELQTQAISNLAETEERFATLPSNNRLSIQTSPDSKRSSAQTRFSPHLRRIQALTASARTLQAKMHLLYDDSIRALSTATPDLVPIQDQYDSLGADIRALLQAWEAGRAMFHEADVRAIVGSPTRRSIGGSSGSRRSSGRFSFGPRSSISNSLGGLTVVDEDSTIPASPNTPVDGSGSPASALRALIGDDVGPTPLSARPLSPPPTDEDEPSSEEVYEAVSEPKTSSLSARQAKFAGMSREQRIAAMKEEREKEKARVDLLREKKEVTTNMVRELQSVINLRASQGVAKRKRGLSMGAARADAVLAGASPLASVPAPMASEI